MLNIPAVAKSDQLFSAMEPARGGRREFRSMWLTFHIDERNKNGIPFTDWHSTCITRTPPMHTCMTMHAVLHQLSNAQNSSRIYKFISRSQSFMCPTFRCGGGVQRRSKWNSLKFEFLNFPKCFSGRKKRPSTWRRWREIEKHVEICHCIIENSKQELREKLNHLDCAIKMAQIYHSKWHFYSFSNACDFGRVQQLENEPEYGETREINFININ